MCSPACSSDLSRHRTFLPKAQEGARPVVGGSDEPVWEVGKGWEPRFVTSLQRSIFLCDKPQRVPNRSQR